MRTIVVGMLLACAVTYSIASSNLQSSAQPVARKMSTAKGVVSGSLRGALQTIITGSPYYIDDFDGANDTTALKARGYKVYYRGSSPAGTVPMWFQGNPSVFPALNGPPNGYVASNYETIDNNGDIDNWLVLPPKNVQAGDTLFFSSRSPQGSVYPDTIRVMFSAAGDSVPEALSWIELGRFKVDTSGAWERRGFRAPTSGANARFAIRYAVADGGISGTNSNYIGIDALTIERPGLANDVGTIANLAPTGTVQRSTIPLAPKATIKNFGTAPQAPFAAFDVRYTISPGGYSSTRTVTSLASGATTTVVFDSTFAPATEGTYAVTIVTLLGSDENRANDTLRTTFIVQELNWGGGGPTSGGYYFANSLSVGAPSHPTYNWIDPVAAGHTQAVFADPDDGVISVDMGFNFTYFGTTYTTGSNNLNIYANGFLNLGSPVPGTVYDATGFPDAFNPPNMIAGCLVDLDFTSSNYPDAKIFYGGNASQFVVTYFHGYRWASGGTSTHYISFQSILYPNGNIKIQYNDAESIAPPTLFLNEADVGIQNLTGTAGIAYRVNGVGGPLFGSPLAVEFGTDPNGLPITLAALHVRLNPNGPGVLLEWQTISEVNNYGFFVQRRRGDVQQWMELPGSFVPGHGTSTEPHFYSYVDTALTQTGLYYYRLRQQDLDGTSHLTPSISIEVTSLTAVEERAPHAFQLLQNSPNPFNPTTTIRFSVENTAVTRLQVYNLLGERVATLFDGVAEAGTFYRVTVDGSSWTSGMYVYRLQSGNRHAAKKLLLMK